MALYSENNSDWGFRKNNEAINEVANSDDTYLPEEEATAISEIPDNIYGKFISGTIKTINDKDTTMITEANAIRNQFDLEVLTLPNCTDICRGMIYNCPNLKELNLPAVATPSIINPLLTPNVYYDSEGTYIITPWRNSVIYDEYSSNNKVLNNPMNLVVNLSGITELDTSLVSHQPFCQIGGDETNVKLNFPNLTDVYLNSKSGSYYGCLFEGLWREDISGKWHALYVPLIDFGKNDIHFHGTSDDLYVFMYGDYRMWNEIYMEGITSLGQTVEGKPYSFFYSRYDPAPGVHFPNCKNITNGRRTFYSAGLSNGGGCAYGKFESLEEITSSEYVFYTSSLSGKGFLIA